MYQSGFEMGGAGGDRLASVKAVKRLLGDRMSG